MTRRKMYLCCTLVLSALVIFAATKIDIGRYFFWKMGWRVIDTGTFVRCYNDYDDIPALVGMPIEKAMLSINGIIPASNTVNHGNNPKRIFPNCDEYFWLGTSWILIGVKDGKIIKTGLVKG